MGKVVLNEEGLPGGLPLEGEFTQVTAGDSIKGRDELPTGDAPSVMADKPGISEKGLLKRFKGMFGFGDPIPMLDRSSVSSEMVKTLKVGIKDEGTSHDPMKIYKWMVVFWKDNKSNPVDKFKLSKQDRSRIFKQLLDKGLIEVVERDVLGMIRKPKIKILETEARQDILSEFTPGSFSDDHRIVQETYADIIVKLVNAFDSLDLKTVGRQVGLSPKKILKTVEILEQAGHIRLKHKDVNSILQKIEDSELSGRPLPTGEHEVLDSYELLKDDARLKVCLIKEKRDIKYKLSYPTFRAPTQSILEHIYDKASPDIVGEVNTIEDFGDVKKRLGSHMKDMLDSYFPLDTGEVKKLMLAELTNELDLGRLEYLIKDPNIEEIKAQNDKPVFIKHIGCRQDWVETNITLVQDKLFRYSKAIARQTRQQLDSSTPLMDAVLPSGDRVNVSLPETSGSIIMEIRLFSKSPWNFVRLIKNQTVSEEIMAFLWLALQNKLNILVSGETGSGKTSFINALSIFLPKNDHIISVEDTRELSLPDFFMNWSHMVTKKGSKDSEITMSRLLVNSLRMNPSFIIMGEVRDRKDIMALMKATAMGHPVMSTIHTRDCITTIKRFRDADVLPHDLVNIHLNVILEAIKNKDDPLQSNRRVKEIGEYAINANNIDAHRIYRLDIASDKINRINEPMYYHHKIMDKVNFTKNEIDEDLARKKDVIKWLVGQDIDDNFILGQVIQLYYFEPDKVHAAAVENTPVTKLLENEV
ncbi:ATPase, T2SS/T4P/T4SS family [Candidatus Altiarchaeota archaeon]